MRWLFTTSAWRAVFGAAALALVVLGGCASAGVDLRVANVSLGAATDVGVTIIFSLEATTESSDQIPLRDVKYSLNINGARVFSGVRSAEAAVSPRESSTIRLPVAATWKALGVPDREALEAARLKHRFEAAVQFVPPDIFRKALFTTGLRKPVARVVDEGTLVFAPPGDTSAAHSARRNAGDGGASQPDSP